MTLRNDIPQRYERKHSPSVELEEQLTPPGRQATYKSMCESQALKLQNVGVINYTRDHQLLGRCRDSASATAVRLDGTIEQRALKDPR